MSLGIILFSTNREVRGNLGEAVQDFRYTNLLFDRKTSNGDNKKLVSILSISKDCRGAIIYFEISNLKGFKNGI
jgi:hypothetical protein